MTLRERIRSLSDERWAVGLFRNSIAGLLAGEKPVVDWVNDPVRDRWFADPFILDANEQEIVLLVEEINKSYRNKQKGRISRLAIRRADMSITDVTPILELDTHLSFPAILRKDGQVYIYPENSESGQLTLYRYDDQSRACSRVGSICDDAVTDAIISDALGQQLMFATTRADANGNTLHIYSKPDDSADRFTQCDSVRFGENVARMAGQLFEHEGKVYRPTQECNVQYGHAITLQQVQRTPQGWQLTEVRRIYSTHPRLRTGTHTFNVHQGLIATDALGFDRMWIRRCLKTLGLIH